MGFFCKDKVDKPLVRLNKKKEDSNKIRNERGDFTTANTNTKDHKKLLCIIIHQQIGQPGRNR